MQIEYMEHPYLSVTFYLRNVEMRLPCAVRLKPEQFYSEWAVQNQMRIKRVASNLLNKPVSVHDQEFADTAMALYVNAPYMVEGRDN